MKIFETKIALIGAYGEGNVGDDLLMDNLLTWLNNRFPNVKPLLLVRNKKEVLKIIKNHRVDVFDDYDSYDLEVDIAIYGGGTQFFDFKLKKNVYYHTRLNQVLNPIKTLRKKLANKKIVSKENILLGVGFGPFENKNSLGYRKFKDVIEKASFVCVRDQASYKLANEIYKGELILGTDICFNSFFYQRLQPFIKPNVNVKLSSKRQVKKIAIILRQWNYDNIDQIQLFDSIKTYVNQKPEINFDLLLFRYEKDKVILKSFKDIKNLNIITWRPSFDSFEDFLTNYTSYDLIITSRFHGAIFSGLLNIPFVCIEVDPKLSIPNMIWNKKGAFRSPFTFEQLENVVEITRQEDFNYSDLSKEEIAKGDEMLNLVERFIHEKL